jgi:hypothetical protein
VGQDGPRSLAVEVARIKAEFAARNAAWTAASRARLEQSPATSRQLAEACGCSVNGPFSGFLSTLRSAGRLLVVGTIRGRQDLRVRYWSGRVIAEVGRMLAILGVVVAN